MNRKSELLKRTAKAVMIAALLCVAGMMNVTQAQSVWEQTQNYLFYLVYADYQTCEHLMPEREGSKYDAVRRNLLLSNENYPELYIWGDPTGPVTTGIIGLAKNEKEGFQVFFREQEKERNLRIEISPFLNSQNEALQHTVYWEEFFWPEGIWDENSPNADSLAEALVPYAGEIKRTSVGHNKVFYVELQSSKNQTSGEYVSTITAYDGSEVIDTRTVIARVWNFALPENHYSEVVMGLYNRNSGYKSTSSFLTLNGIQVDNGNVAPVDMEEAKRILDGYQNCLLEHGVSTYEIPRWLMEDDSKEAELTMADPRRKVFTVPVLYGDLNNSGYDFKPEAHQMLQQYKNIVYDNPFLKDKAFFYPYDEPENATDFANIDRFCSVLSDYWHGYHATVPFYSEYFSTVEAYEGKIDILCPNQGAFNPSGGLSGAEARLQDFKTRNHTWRYQGDGQCGGLYGFIHAIAPVGTMRRILFWQQYAINSDGFLNWNCAYLPNDWVKKTLPASGGIQTGNGDGVLLYPGTMFGQDAAMPVVSLRLKQLSEGIDDYDYLRLAKEFLGENYANERLGDVFWNYNNLAYLCYIINRQVHPEWEGYYPNNCKWMNNARHRIGEALNALANTEHDWGEWQTAVLPDDTHNGLEIRTCSHCGAQESREKTFLYRFVGTEDNQWANLNNWEGNPETLPASGEAVVIAHDCEIDTNTTVFNVIVNDGINLTVNEGATLTSVRMSTGEDAQVIIEDGAQLYTHSEGVQATVKKNIAAHGDLDGWYLISTSLASDVEPSMDNGMVPATEESRDLYRFEQSEYLEWRNYQADSFNLENGQGYLYASQSETTLNFTGQLNASNANISVPIFYGSGTLAGLNLVGNPFASDAYLMDENNEIMPFYRMNETGDTIVAVQAGTAIKPCEGVFVICPDDRETHAVIFTTTVPENIGDAQDVPPVSLPIHGLPVNQDAFLDGVTQTTALSAGWNWFSTYIAIEDPEEGMQMLQNALGENGLKIMSSDDYTTYEDGAWGAMGDLEELENEQTYMILTSAACTVELQGMRVNPSGYTITIKPGWNWIGFPSAEVMSVEDAFADFEAEEGDKIMTKDDYTTYEDGAWGAMGDLEELTPGQGLKYYSVSTETKTLVFPANKK